MACRIQGQNTQCQCLLILAEARTCRMTLACAHMQHVKNPSRHKSTHLAHVKALSSTKFSSLPKKLHAETKPGVSLSPSQFNGHLCSEAPLFFTTITRNCNSALDLRLSNAAHSNAYRKKLRERPSHKAFLGAYGDSFCVAAFEMKEGNASHSSRICSADWHSISH